MAFPLIPILLISGLTGGSGFIVGTSLSNKLGTALQIAGVVFGLFLVFVMAQRFQLFNLFKG